MNRVSAALLTLMTTPVLGLNIQLDFMHDEAADRFFSSNPEAKSAVEKAAKDIGDMISTSFAQVQSDIYTGVNGSTTARFDWSWNYINPVNGQQETIHDPSIAEDTVIVYVGTRNLSGQTLGQGGAGGAGVQISGAGLPHEWIDAVDLAEANSNAEMSRGGGPNFGTISGAANYSGYIGRYDLDYGLTVGNLWFDADTDNDGSRDADSELSDFWHYDASTPVAAGKTDLYSVALHEILHVLGIGTSQTWEDLANNGQWGGASASAKAGSSSLIDADGHHAISGLMSRRLSDGILQESVISPSITPGVRKELTELDMAFLSDLGFDSATPVPEPEASLLTLLSCSLLLVRRSK